MSAGDRRERVDKPRRVAQSQVGAGGQASASNPGHGDQWAAGEAERRQGGLRGDVVARIVPDKVDPPVGAVLEQRIIGEGGRRTRAGERAAPGCVYAGRDAGEQRKQREECCECQTEG